MRRVLFIAYLYPPIANSGTRRSIEFANHLPDCAWSPTVLTVADPDTRPDRYDPSLLDDVRAGTVVERVPSGSDVWARRLSGWLPARWRARAQGALEWRLRNAWRVPDDAGLWRWQATRKGLALHRERPFDLVYASGSPWTSFLVARDIGRAADIPYVLDYRDMWSPSGDASWDVETRLQSLFRRRLERRAAGDAAAVVTVTELLVEAIGQHCGRDDLTCITNGFEPKDFASLPAPARDGKVRISYTGVWRRGYGPELLYQAVRLAKDRRLPGLERLIVDAAGFAPGRARELAIDDVVHEHGRVGHEAALTMAARSDAVFLPVSEGFYARSSLPGKLFEYIGSGRPILAAVPSDSEVARVLRDVGGCWRIDPDDVEAAVRVIGQLCAGAGAAGSSLRKDDRLQTYTRAATAARLASVFDEALARHRDRRAG